MCIEQIQFSLVWFIFVVLLQDIREISSWLLSELSAVFVPGLKIWSEK